MGAVARRTLVVAIAFFPALLWSAQPRALAPQIYSALQFRHVGPPGNKLVAVAGVPGAQTVYVGASTGGVFKTDDGGDHWHPVFDSQDVESIGTIAISPSDPERVWVGTGDSAIRENISMGKGIYLSTDAGSTWKCMGLERTGRISRIAVHPTDPLTVFVAAPGRGWAPSQDRGIYRTRDGGVTWQRVLFVDDKTGGVDIVISPKDPNVIFAATWQLEMHPWGNEGGGPGSGLYVSRDGGTSWNRLTTGLPTGPLGRIALAVSQNNPNRLFALIASVNQGSLWRSDDDGATWAKVSDDKRLTSRSQYYGRIAVFPDDPDELISLEQNPYHTRDGGRTFRLEPLPMPDQHDLWIDPLDPKRVFIVNDRYIYRSINRTRSYNRIGLPTAQMYRVAVDHALPYNLYGCRHDGYGFRGPSIHYNTPANPFVPQPDQTGGYISYDLWNWVFCGEAGWAIPDPDRPEIMWGTSWFEVYRVTNLQRPVDVTPWKGEKDLPRLARPIPTLISAHSPRKLWVASQNVRESSDDGKTWRTISPDLTTAAFPKLGGHWADMIGIDSAISSLADSRLEKDLLWAGSTDGLIHVTRDAGAHWSNVTPPPSLLPPGGLVSSIAASRYIPGVAYVTVDRHRADDQRPYVLRTADYGKSWKLVVGQIPTSMLSYAQVVAEDPVRRGMLYLGTQNALYVSLDDGGSWHSLRNNLPGVPISWLTVQEDANDLVLATFGRGFQILDDLSPLQQLTPAVLRERVHLFPPRRTYKFQILSVPITADAMAEELDVPAAIGRDPPYGAPLNYFLASTVPGEVRLRILDGAGKTVRELAGTNNPGINRVWWNLRGEAQERPVEEEEEAAPPLVVAGKYTVELTAEGVTVTSVLDVLNDPANPAPDVDMTTSSSMMMDDE